MRVSEIRVNQIRVNQGLGVLNLRIDMHFQHLNALQKVLKFGPSNAKNAY